MIIQEFVLKKLLAKKQVGHVGKAELKIMVILLYFTIFGAMGAGANTYINIVEGFQDSTRNYIFCESIGTVTNFDCRELLDPDMTIVIHLLTTGLMALLLWPVVILIFSLNLKDSYLICKNKWAKSFGSSTTKTGSSSA